MKIKKVRDTSKAWITGVERLSWLIDDYYEKENAIVVSDEAWTITGYKYSVERYRLTVEFDTGDFLLIVEYSKKNQMLTVTAWTDRRIISDETGPEYDDDGRDEDSVRVLQLVYMPKVCGRSRNESGLMLRDPECGFDFARPKQVTLFAHLVGKLEEFAERPRSKPFEFRPVLEYAKRQQVLLDSFKLMRRGLVDAREEMRKDWDTLSDY